MSEDDPCSSDNDADAIALFTDVRRQPNEARRMVRKRPEHQHHDADAVVADSTLIHLVPRRRQRVLSAANGLHTIVPFRLPAFEAMSAPSRPAAVVDPTPDAMGKLGGVRYSMHGFLTGTWGDPSVAAPVFFVPGSRARQLVHQRGQL